MLEKQFMPALLKYTDVLSASVISKKTLGVTVKSEEKQLKKLSGLYESVYELTDVLAGDISKGEGFTDLLEQAEFYHDTVFDDMGKVRAVADEAEPLIPEELMPYPTYEQMLFYV